MISERDHLAALAKVIRQCAAEARNYQSGLTYGPYIIEDISHRMLDLLTPAMLEAEKQNAANSSNTQQMP